MGAVIDKRLLLVARDVNFSLPGESQDNKISYISDALWEKEHIAFDKSEVEEALEEAKKTF